MNISTYEARIKALEDQLNPPGPSGEGGILSVTVTPDITLFDGTTLSDWLSDTLPIAEGVVNQLLNSRDALINDQLYEVSATPIGNWCISDGTNFGLPGLNITTTETVTNGALKINIISASDPQDHTAPFAQLKLTIAGGE